MITYYVTKRCHMSCTSLYSLLIDWPMYLRKSWYYNEKSFFIQCMTAYTNDKLSPVEKLKSIIDLTNFSFKDPCACENTFNNDLFVCNIIPHKSAFFILVTIWIIAIDYCSCMWILYPMEINGLPSQCRRDCNYSLGLGTR